MNRVEVQRLLDEKQYFFLPYYDSVVHGHPLGMERREGQGAGSKRDHRSPWLRPIRRGDHTSQSQHGRFSCEPMGQQPRFEPSPQAVHGGRSWWPPRRPLPAERRRQLTPGG